MVTYLDLLNSEVASAGLVTRGLPVACHAALVAFIALNSFLIYFQPGNVVWARFWEELDIILGRH